jgi:hypothetical protein
MIATGRRRCLALALLALAAACSSSSGNGRDGGGTGGSDGAAADAPAAGGAGGAGSGGTGGTGGMPARDGGADAAPADAADAADAAGAADAGGTADTAPAADAAASDGPRPGDGNQPADLWVGFIAGGLDRLVFQKADRALDRCYIVVLASPSRAPPGPVMVPERWEFERGGSFPGLAACSDIRMAHPGFTRADSAAGRVSWPGMYPCRIEIDVTLTFGADGGAPMSTTIRAQDLMVRAPGC